MTIKRILLSIFMCFVSFSWVSHVVYGDLSSSPDSILKDMKNTDIQNTKLDNVNWKWINNNLSSIKTNSRGYIDWIWFLWLSVALILIMYNGLYILANFSNEDKLSKVKNRFMSLIIGVVVLTSWYLIIKLLVSVLWNIFK